MKLPLHTILTKTTTLLLLITITTIYPNPTHAHFFRNISSIPPSLAPNATAWDEFNALVGCHKGQKIPGVAKIKKYFQHFGYLDTVYSDFSDSFDDPLESAVKTYQLNFHLDPTGQLDTPTLSHVTLPRCGNPDIINGTSTMTRNNSNNSPIHTVSHYSFFPNRPRWGTRHLTYAFQPDNGLSPAIRAVFARAFQRWSEVIPMTFNEASSYAAADIRIGFYGGEHGDGEAFDGVLGTLAHAFSPPVGILHMDRDEYWVIDGEFFDAPRSAVDLESVAVHEIGHVLGLGHSEVEEAIMYPTISSRNRKVELAGDDVMGIQELYGSNPNYNGSSTLTPRGARDTSGVGDRSVVVDYSLFLGLLYFLVLIFV